MTGALGMVETKGLIDPSVHVIPRPHTEVDSGTS